LFGELDVSRQGATASSALETARRLSRVAEQRLRLCIMAVRYRVKQGRFHDARVLADSLLTAWPEPSAPVAQWLAPIAAVTGRARMAAHLIRLSAPLAPRPSYVRGWSDPPQPVISAWLALTAFAALGAPTDSVTATLRQLETLLSLVEPAARPMVRSALLREPARFLGAWLREEQLDQLVTDGDAILQMQLSLRRANPAALRKQFESLERAREHFRLVDRWPDAVLLESQALAASGDTVAAVAMIDPYLAALPVLHPAILDRVQTAASLPHLMLQRARFALASGDVAVERRWVSALEELWANADPELRQLLRPIQHDKR
jgi:hypothetical protein